MGSYVNMQYDLSEVLLGVQGVLMCWGVRMLPLLLADALHASLHNGCVSQHKG